MSYAVTALIFAVVAILRTFQFALQMSAFRRKTDMSFCGANVR
jgi:hypothetical protein